MRTSRWGSGRQRGGSGGTDTRCTAAPAGCVSRTQTAVAPEDFVPFRKFSVLLCSLLARPPRPCGWFTSERSRLLGHTRPGLGASCCPRSLCPRRWAHSLPSRVPASLRPLPPPRRDVHRHSPCHRPPGPTWAALHGIVLGPRPRPDPSVQSRGRPPGASGERGGDHPSLEVAAPARQAPQHPSLSWLSDTSTARRHCCRRHWDRPATLVHDTSDSKPRQPAEQGTKNVTMSRRTHVRSRLERGQIPRLVAVGRAVGVRAPVEVTVPRLGTPVPRKDVSTRIRKERFRREQWARRGRTSWRAGHLCAATPCR